VACIADLSVDRSSLLAAYERVVEERKERDEWLLNERDLSAKINELLIEAREKNVTLTAQVQALEQELTDLRRVGREERDVLRAFVKRGIVEHGVGADDCPTCREATLLLSKEPTP